MKLRQLFEGPRTAVMAFGRMNPPTIGHAKLVDAVKSQGGDPYIFLSQSQKPKTDPLAFADKLRYAKFFFPEVTIGNPEVKTIIQALKKISDLGYENLIYVAGSDRVQAFEELINKYNGGDDYSFKSIKVVSAGERDPDADGAEGMSASKMRAAAAAGDLESFKQGVPNQEVADEMFAAVRKGMGIAEIEPAESIGAAINFPGYEEKPKKNNKKKKEKSWLQKAKELVGLDESDVVIDPVQLRQYLRMLIDDAIDKEQDIDKLSKVLKILVGKEIKSRGKRYQITSEDVVSAFEASCKSRRKKKMNEETVELPDGSTKTTNPDGSYTTSGAEGKKFYDKNGKLIKTQTPVINGLSTIKYADGRARYIFYGGGLEARGPLEGDKPGEADYLSYAFGGAKFIFDARKGQPVINGSITIGRLKVELTGKVLDRPAFHKNPRQMMTQILGGDPLAVLKDPMAVKPMLEKGTAKIYLDGKETSAEQLAQAVEQGL